MYTSLRTKFISIGILFFSCLNLLTTCYTHGRIDVPATRHLYSCSNTIGYIDKSFGELFRVNVLPRIVYAQNTVRPHVLIDYDKIIALSYPIQLTIHIQTTSEGGLIEFAFNSNQLNANYVCRVDRP